MQRLKATVTEFIDTHKKKSNAYWTKIKDALNKLNSKIASAEKDVMDLNVKMEHFHH